MKKGFTLAEVLITLAIIGIVAALTIPSLANGYQKRVLTTQLQKTYAEISQAAATVMANEMGDDFRRSKAITDMKFIGGALSATSGNKFASEYGFFDDTNAQVDILSYAGLDRNNYKCGALKSGAAICFDKSGKGIMDTNGGKGPNLIGRDAFIIGFNADGSICSEYSAVLESIIDNDWDIDKAEWKW